MVKCVFCGRETSPHKGVHLIANDGNVRFFCSSKCRKNSLKLKRDNRKVRWAEAFHITREKARVKAREFERKEIEKKKEEKQAEKPVEKVKKEHKKEKSEKK